jgi:hypothetical protein
MARAWRELGSLKYLKTPSLTMGGAPPWALLAFSFRVRNEKRILLARAPIVSEGVFKYFKLPSSLQALKNGFMDDGFVGSGIIGIGKVGGGAVANGTAASGIVGSGVNRRVGFLFFVFGLCLLLFLGIEARANFSNYNSILMGDQAAGMGGAAVAMDEDSAGMAFYNPATLAKLEGQSFSAAVGIYKKFDTRFNDDGDITKASLRANQGFFRALPSSTASVIRPDQIPFLKGYTLALSIITPEYDNFQGDVKLDGDSSSTLNMTTESLWVGGALAKRISTRESVGLTLYYTARSVSKIASDITYIDATHSKIFSRRKKHSPEWDCGGCWVSCGF